MQLCFAFSDFLFEDYPCLVVIGKHALSHDPMVKKNLGQFIEYIFQYFMTEWNEEVENTKSMTFMLSIISLYVW